MDSFYHWKDVLQGLYKSVLVCVMPDDGVAMNWAINGDSGFHSTAGVILDPDGYGMWFGFISAVWCSDGSMGMLSVVVHSGMPSRVRL